VFCIYRGIRGQSWNTQSAHKTMQRRGNCKTLGGEFDSSFASQNGATKWVIFCVTIQFGWDSVPDPAAVEAYCSAPQTRPICENGREGTTPKSTFTATPIHHGALAGDQRRNILTVEAHNRKLNTLNVRRLCRSSKNTHLIHFTSKQAPITYTAHTYRQCMQNPYRFTFLSAFFAQEMQDNDD